METVYFHKTMKQKKYINTLSPLEKAREMVDKYGFTDAKIQVNQVIFFIEEKDVKTRKYWDQVLLLLKNPWEMEETHKEKKKSTKSYFFQ